MMKIALKKKIRHGFAREGKRHPLYQKWHDMKSRTLNRNNKKYDYYGGRGIVVCDEWKHDPVAFINWGLLNGWEPGLLLDRKDNDGNYEPSNCRFVTPKESMHNTRLLFYHNTSGYRGVSYHKSNGNWQSRITINNKLKHLGSFNSARLAALRYDVEAYLIDERPRNFI